MSIDIWTKDYGFDLEFASKLDLTTLTNVRLIIKRPDNTTDMYDFLTQSFDTIVSGDSLVYTTRETDFPIAGIYKLQLFGKDATKDIALGPVYKITVIDRIVNDSWS